MWLVNTGHVIGPILVCDWSNTGHVITLTPSLLHFFGWLPSIYTTSRLPMPNDLQENADDYEDNEVEITVINDEQDEIEDEDKRWGGESNFGR